MFTAQAHAGRADLEPLIAFASASTAARFPLRAILHPGNVIWELMNDFDAPQDMRLWRDGDDIGALAMFVGPGQLWFECLPAAEDLIGEMLRWAEQSSRNAGRPSLSIHVLDQDLARQRLVAARGYAREGPEAVQFRLYLACDVPPLDLPTGMRVRDCVEIDLQARALCHRDAWSHLAHIGLPDARSKFTADSYRKLLAAPLYDPTLDLVVETEEGDLVANCIGWADQESGIGEFEPVGCHVDYRGRGIAGAMMREGARRMKARGLKWARVGTAHFNAAAISAYQNGGFELVDRAIWWRKDLRV